MRKGITMANGKGCEYGRVTRMQSDAIKIDVNKIGSKMDKIYTLLITTLATMLGSIIVGCTVFYITRH